MEKRQKNKPIKIKKETEKQLNKLLNKLYYEKTRGRSRDLKSQKKYSIDECFSLLRLSRGQIKMCISLCASEGVNTAIRYLQVILNPDYLQRESVFLSSAKNLSESCIERIKWRVNNDWWHNHCCVCGEDLNYYSNNGSIFGQKKRKFCSKKCIHFYAHLNRKK